MAPHAVMDENWGAMKVTEGGHLVIESERVGQPPRTGTVEEVLSLDPLRVRVRLENDHGVAN
jgi:Domain of unknown function (DUF1918)